MFWRFAGCALVVVALSVETAAILRLATSGRGSGSVAKQAAGATGTRGMAGYAAAVDKNPFGITARFSEITKAAKVDAAPEPSGFTLRGVITIPPGFAVIDDKDGRQQTFKANENVFGAGTLRIIGERKVELLRASGKPVVLEIASLPVTQEPGKAGQKDRMFNRDQIKRFLDNPREIFTDARMLPNVVASGGQEGFILKEVKPGGFYDTIGLANGDVLMRVNGMPMNSPDDGVKIFNVIKELDRLELDLVRNGTRTTQTYTIR